MMERPQGIPSASGCYIFRDGRGVVVYVGKAKNLASRLSNYFAAPHTLSPKTAAQMLVAEDVEWIVTANETDALILENELIKRYQPRFNIRLKDDKSYPYVALDMRSEFPVPFITRSARTKGVRYFGPFAKVRSVRLMLDQVLTAAPLRTCTSAKYEAHRRRGRACLLFDIKKCAGPCVDAVSTEEYSRHVDRFVDFFTGDVDRLRDAISQEMNEASQNERFEHAAHCRDALVALEAAAVEQHVVLDDRSDLDVIAVAKDGLRSVVSCVQIRKGRIVGRDNRLFDVSSDTSSDEVAQLFVVDYYSSSRDSPDQLVTGDDILDTELIAGAVTQLGGRTVRVGKARGDRQRAIVDMAITDGESVLARDALRRQSDHNVRSQALIEIGAALGLAAPPYRIECFDMSHLQGTNYVGSMVVTIDGLPSRKSYRHFNVKSVWGNDDAGAMREVLTRRLRYYLEEESEKFPKADLIVVDGGLPQLSAACDAVEALGLTEQVELVALAKREELLYRPGSSEPIRLERGSEALHMLQRIRDEAHRFAITFHRSKRGSAMVSSVLDRVEGLGPARQEKLLEHFGSMKNLRAASIDDFDALSWLPSRVARSLYDQLHNRDAGIASLREVQGD